MERGPKKHSDMRTNTTADKMRANSFKVRPFTFWGYIHTKDEALDVADTLCDVAYELSRLPDITHETEHLAGELLKTAKSLRSWIKKQRG